MNENGRRTGIPGSSPGRTPVLVLWSGWHTTRITGVGIAGAGIVLEPARPFLMVRRRSCLTSAWSCRRPWSMVELRLWTWKHGAAA